MDSQTRQSLSPTDRMIGQKILLAFQGKDDLPAQAREAIRHYKPAGFTLFRTLNIASPNQVLQLCGELQRAAREAGLPLLLIGADQEGGQFNAIGEGTTPLPGNLALGATGSVDLARQAGQVLGRELAAMGINLDYAPCCDVNINPLNPVIGTRSFGEDPQQVAELAAAMVQGIQSCGVAATAKHFPGHGDTFSDSHFSIPVVPHSLERLRQVELPPFSAAIRSGAKLVMTSHIALPVVDGREDLPATLSPAILRGLLREELGFQGVIVTDAMDMQAIRQGDALGEEAVKAANAGADLLLVTSNPDDHRRVHSSLMRASREGSVEREQIDLSVKRVLALKAWLASQPPQPDLSVVGCAVHRAVADRVAEASITLVRNEAGLLPLTPATSLRLAVVLPKSVDLTPADTSSYVIPRLAQELRQYLPNVYEMIVPHEPKGSDIAAVLDQLDGCDLVILGTQNAFTQPGQSALARAILATGIPAVIVALRMPYDLAAFPEAKTYLCTYSILEPSIRVLTRALFDPARIHGRLPVTIPGLYPRGFGIAG